MKTRQQHAIERAGLLARAETYLDDAVALIDKAANALGEAGHEDRAQLVEEIGDRLAKQRNWAAKED